MKKRMYKYSFLYKSGEKTIVELINYLERVYKLKFITIFNANSFISFSVPFISLSLFDKKELIFEAPRTFYKIKLCKKCNFPVEFSDVKTFLYNPRNKDKQCRNCEEPIYTLIQRKYVELKNKIKIQNEI